MSYVEVIVDCPGLRGRGVFTYSVPPHLDLDVGDLVRVPFGSRHVQGVVCRSDAEPPPVGAKDVLEIVEPLAVWPWQMALVEWLAGYYCCSLSEAVRLVLPPGFRRRAFSAIKLADRSVDVKDLSAQEFALVSLLQRSRAPISRARARAVLGRNALESALKTLTRRGVVQCFEQQSSPPKPKVEFLVRLAPQVEAEQVLSEVRAGSQQRRVIEFLLEREAQAGEVEDGWTGVAAAALCRETGCGIATIKTLQRRGLVELEAREVLRSPLAGQRYDLEKPLPLTAGQQEVWLAVASELARPGAKTFLLHGVTASGKTEIYLRALASVLGQNRQGIVLVPEIALTPQTIRRFAARFPGRIAVIHSSLSPGELFDEWRRIRSGEVDVVIGSRSALFAPLPRLGLVVVDEEHEWTYKQDTVPRYHARDVAVKMAEILGAKVILGSATPDVVSYYRAKIGRYALLRLPERVMRVGSTGGGGPAIGPGAAGTASQAGSQEPGLPPVDVVDMRQELRAGNRSIFSRLLVQMIGQTLADNQQAILFINRRGTATFVLCRDCGHVLKCRRCDIALVYHGPEDFWSGPGMTVCHRCNRQSKPPANCPRCRGSRIRYFGVGTQRVESEVLRLFPNARVVRWDRDVSRSPKDHERTLNTFASRQADVLVGTQMVAKGLDFPLVTLVGVIDADTAIHLPDLRAGERTFQLLTQVAGRAGRAHLGGRVVVQTYSPHHYCIQAASRHDFEGFYKREIEFRRQHGYPPLKQLAKLVCTHSSEKHCREEAERVAAVLRREVELLGVASLEVIGPAPAYYHRVRGKSRWQIVVRGTDVHPLLDRVTLPLGWAVDVDPMSLL